MNKMAIFVEGYTEQEFVTKLIFEIAHTKQIRIRWKRIVGGTTIPRRCYKLQACGANMSDCTHFVLVYDCGGDAAVKTRMREEYDNLVNAGHSQLICIRDVFPTVTLAELPKLEVGLQYGVKRKPLVVDFILSVMEVEAWFLAEWTHLEKIDPSLTVARIACALGFDPSIDDMQLRPSPCMDLENSYALAGHVYRKGAAKRTVDALDFAAVYVEVVDKFPHLKKLCGTISGFLDS